jgi:hypothetical protein
MRRDWSWWQCLGVLIGTHVRCPVCGAAVRRGDMGRHRDVRRRIEFVVYQAGRKHVRHS